MNLCRITHWVFLCCALASPANASQNGEWPVPRGKSRETHAYRYDPVHLAKAPKKFKDDAAAVLVYYGITHLVEAGGTVESVTHEVTRLNGRKGVANLGEYQGITFDPAFQKLILNEARVIKPDGTIIPVQPQHVKLRDAGTDYEVYEPKKELVISFPGLQVGDVYEVKWTTRGKHPEDFDQFFTRYQFGTVHYPIVRDEFRVRLPKSKKLQFKVINGNVNAVVHESRNYRHYQWVLKNHPALPRDYDLPSREELRLQILCSTYPSWQAVAQWKLKVRKDCWECTPKIKQIVAKTTKGLKNQVDKARVLTHWVRRNIRYVSVVSAGHRYRPRKPAAVINNSYGDCKDQAQLLAVMLREANIEEVRLVTLGYFGDGHVVPEVPSPWGTHAILLVKIDGKDHWIDTTGTLAGWDFLPRQARDRIAYVTDSKGGISVRRTPPLTWKDNRTEQISLVRILADGTSDHTRLAKYHGHAALNKRDAWLDEPPGERRRKLSAELRDDHSRSKLLRLQLDAANVKDLDAPVSAEIQFQIHKHFSGDASLEASFIDGGIWSRFLAYNPDDRRKAAMDLIAPIEIKHRFIIQLPPAYLFSTSSRQRNIESRWGFFCLDVEREPGDDRHLEIKFHLRITDPRVNVKDFAEYRNFHQAVRRNWRVWLAICNTDRLSDVSLLEKAVAENPKDLITAKTLANILIRHGQKSQAQIVLDRARQSAPDNIELWELSVQACETYSQEEAIYRQMIRQFPRRLDYAVALGNTLIARNMHAEAEFVLTKLTEGTPPDICSRAQFQLARLARIKERPAKTLYHVHQALEADKGILKEIEVLMFLGNLYTERNELDIANLVFQKVLKSDPNNKVALAKLVRLEISANRPIKAAVYLREFSHLVKNDLEGLVQAAKLHLQMGRADDALELALRARDIDFHADCQKILGLIYFKRGNYRKAVFHLDRAHRDEEVLEKLIQGHLTLGNLENAIKLAVVHKMNRPRNALLSQTIDAIHRLKKRKHELAKHAKRPQNPALDWFVCAEWAYLSGQRRATIDTLLEKVFVSKSPPGPAYALRGYLALNKGRLRSAFADAQQSIELGPEEGLGYYVRGRVLYERCDNAALPDLIKAAKLSERKNAEMLHWLAATYWDAGMRREAVRTQREAVKLRPNDNELTAQLLKFEAKK